MATRRRDAKDQDTNATISHSNIGMTTSQKSHRQRVSNNFEQTTPSSTLEEGASY